MFLIEFNSIEEYTKEDFSKKEILFSDEAIAMYFIFFVYY
jgi:hypothetical protein